MVDSFLFFFQQILSFLLCLLRTSSLYSKGQKLSISFKRTKRALQQYFVTHVEDLDENECNILHLLINQYDDASPIRPKDTIDLNYNTELTAAGLMLTYMVVLLQFKIGENM